MVDAIAGNKHELIECAFEIGPNPWDETPLYWQFRCFPPGLERFEAACEAFVDQPAQFFDLPHPLPSWTDLLAENILPEFFDSDTELDQVEAVHLYDVLNDVEPDTNEDDLVADSTATSNDEGDSDGESPPGDDSEAEEDTRSYDGCENDD